MGTHDAGPPLTRADRIAGCLLGGAVGDALGAPIEFMRLSEIRQAFGAEGLRDFAPAYGRLGAITDDTQMTLFTAEGLLRAARVFARDGACDGPAIVHGAYLRWFRTQRFELPASVAASLGGPDGDGHGWLYGVRGLWSRRGPGRTCLDALRSGACGRLELPPINDSKGCGGVMRASPAAAMADSPDAAFELGCRTAVITHGHPSGWLAAGALAAIVYEVLDGRPVRGGVAQALRLLSEDPRSRECVAALDAALVLERRGRPSPEKLTTLGEGWIAEEALAIGVYAALVAETFEDGVLLAVNHGGDSDSTGSIAGNILGAARGRGAIPARWLEALELRDVIAEVASDLDTRFRDDEEWRRKYPGE